MDKTKDYTITITVTVRQAKDYWYNSPKGEAEFVLQLPGNILAETTNCGLPINLSFEHLVQFAINKFEDEVTKEEKTDENNPK